MEINVGTALNYKGRSYICISVEKIDVEEIAKEDSASLRNYYASTENVRVLQMEIDIFHIGDIIHRVGERITLECPGVDVQFVYTIVRITKKEDLSNELFGTEGSIGEGATGEAKSSRPGNSGREGNGTPRPS
jgi:hypothetical protein